MRAYTGEQILKGCKVFVRQRTFLARIVGGLTDDEATVDLYVGYAGAGRAAFWIRAIDDAQANRAVRCLADHEVLHFRHYGHRKQVDIHASEAGAR